MHWTEVYRAKIKTAAEALEVVKSNDRVYIHQGSNEPEELVRALIARGHQYGRPCRRGAPI